MRCCCPWLERTRSAGHCALCACVSSHTQVETLLVWWVGVSIAVPVASVGSPALWPPRDHSRCVLGGCKPCHSCQGRRRSGWVPRLWTDCGALPLSVAPSSRAVLSMVFAGLAGPVLPAGAEAEGAVVPRTASQAPQGTLAKVLHFLDKTLTCRNVLLVSLGCKATGTAMCVRVCLYCKVMQWRRSVFLLLVSKGVLGCCWWPLQTLRVTSGPPGRSGAC